MALPAAAVAVVQFVCILSLLHACLASLRGVSLLQASIRSPQQIVTHQEDDCSALEVHLALTESDSAVRVVWRTLGVGCSSSVQYGLAQQGRRLSDEPQLLTVGTSDQITENLMCEPPAKAKPFRVILHTAVLSGLDSNTEYWYQVDGSDTTLHFFSPRSTGVDSPFSFIAFGDMGETTYRSRKSPMAAATLVAIQNEADSHPVDFILHMGDLAYADGKYKVWDSFMKSIEPISSRVPYMIGVGNHEYDYTEGTENDPSGGKPYHPDWGNYGGDSGGECGAMTSHRFLMPQSSSADNPPFWYSYDYGTVHFTIVSTEHDLSPGSRQHRWLEQNLQSVDRCVTPWVVVGMHRPMYVVYPHKDNRVVGEHLRDSLEDLLMKYEVDFTISGHVHSYYRTCDVYDEKCVKADQQGITHFVIGSAGHKLSGLEDDQRGWCEEAVQDYGFGRFTVDGDQVRMQFILSEDGSVADEVVLRSKVAPGDACRRHAQSEQG